MRDQGQFHASYMRQATRAFEARTGLRLIDVRPDVEMLPSPIQLSKAVFLDTPPDAYARAISERCGFINPDEQDADLRNHAIAELLTHVARNPDWTLGRDGSAYARDGDDILRVSPHVGKEDGTSFGYDVSRSTTGTLGTEKGAVRTWDTAFRTESRGVELEEAVAVTVNAPAPT